MDTTSFNGNQPMNQFLHTFLCEFGFLIIDHLQSHTNIHKLGKLQLRVLSSDFWPSTYRFLLQRFPLDNLVEYNDSRFQTCFHFVLLSAFYLRFTFASGTPTCVIHVFIVLEGNHFFV